MECSKKLKKDLFIDSTKTELEKGQIKLKNENEILKDKVNSIEGQMKDIFSMVSEMVGKAKS